MAWPLKMGAIGCPKTSITTNLRCVTSQKSEDFFYTASEASNCASSIVTCIYITPQHGTVYLQTTDAEGFSMVKLQSRYDTRLVLVSIPEMGHVTRHSLKLTRRCQTLGCPWPRTKVFHLKGYRAKEQSCLVSASFSFRFCCVLSGKSSA